MFRTLLKNVGEFKKASILTPIYTSLEVLVSAFIPYVTASIIDRGINGGDHGEGDLSNVCLYGGVMLFLAFLSLFFGIRAGTNAAYASTGFACNLRDAMYRNIQTFSFSNIDRFSSAGLITRMTTDVSNMQNAFQQVLRASVRAPLNLVFSIFMCVLINWKMSIIFIVAMLVLGCALFFIISKTVKLFSKVFVKYDDLNKSVQENVQAIRVVKAFVREDYENIVRDTGLSISCMDICDMRNGKEKADDLPNYDFVILGGGHVPTENAFFTYIGLREGFSGFNGIVMGISAGTMNCARIVYAQPEMPGEAKDPDYERFIPGLGLTEYNILPHYNAVKNDIIDGMRLIEDIAFSDSIGHTFFAITDGSYLLQTEEKAEICGEAYMIRDGRIEQICSNGDTFSIPF